MTGSDSLVALLMSHPFADDQPLLHTATTAVLAGEARSAAQERAARLRAAGIGPGDAVAAPLANDPAAVIAMFGIWLAGAVLVPLNPRAPQPEQDDAIAATRPRAVFTDGAVALLDDAQSYDPGVAFVLWTSGTTGRPKPVLHTHAGYLELLDRVLGPLRGRPAPPRRGGPVGSREARGPSPNLIPVALAANAGIYNVLFGLRAGAALVLMERFTASEFATLVAMHGIRSTVLPPAAITMLNDAPEVDDLTPLRYIRSITAPLSPLQARRCADRFGVAVLNSYGQAEIGEVIGWTAADARDHPEHLGAAGRPHPGVDVRIAEPDADHIGRLLVRPPSMAAGYASGADLADRLDAAGFVDTGDLARIDDDGFVWIEGRAGDLINRGGNKVFPEQVEEVLRLLPEVADVAVVARADVRLGQVPVAYVVVDGAVTDEKLEACCRAHLVAYKVPVAFHRVAALARNDAGKLMRAAIAAGAKEKGD